MEVVEIEAGVLKQALVVSKEGLNLPQLLLLPLMLLPLFLVSKHPKSENSVPR